MACVLLFLVLAVTATTLSQSSIALATCSSACSDEVSSVYRLGCEGAWDRCQDLTSVTPRVNPRKPKGQLTPEKTWACRSTSSAPAAKVIASCDPQLREPQNE